jgi:hypothetical protein
MKKNNASSEVIKDIIQNDDQFIKKIIDYEDQI